MNAGELLSLIRDLYSRNPEYRYREPWELAWLLFSLRYSDELEDEGEIAAAARVAKTDSPEEAA